MLRLYRTSREPPISAPYLRLKNSLQDFKVSTYSGLQSRKTQKLERKSILSQTIKKIDGPFGEKKILKKSLTMPKNLIEGLFSLARYCYAERREKFFGQFPGPTGTICRLPLNVVELFVELFWSLQV